MWTAVLALAASVLVASEVGRAAHVAPGKQAARPARPPKGWTGQVKFHYAINFPTQEQTDVTETANVTLRQIASRPPGFYWVKSGRIAWTGSSQEANTGCKWTASGSRAATKYDAFFDISGRPYYKAAWSSPDDLAIHVAYSCPPPYSDYEADVTVLHPFFPLARKTAGVRVNKKMTLIAGSSPHSEKTSFGTESWSYTWSFHSTR
jgi:hypothetical protein